MTTDARPVHRVGTRALLVDLPDLSTAMAWHAHLSAHPLPGQRDVVAAARTVLVVLDSPSSATRALEQLRTTRPSGASAGGDHRTVTVDVVYDGPDLQVVADQLGMTVDGVIEHHTSSTWTGAFGGFAPGFTYCVGDAVPSVARRDSPRTEVPAGAVGLAGEFSAVYPRSSPGGWQLIGTSTTPVWDASEQEPALIRPGDRVVYRAVRERVEVRRTTPQRDGGGHDHPSLTLTDPGLLTLVEDAGRPGHAGVGVTTSGAADAASAQVANDVVGNRPGDAVLENIGGLTLTAVQDVVVAVTGADTAVTVDGRRRVLASPLLLTAGSTLSVGAARAGLRSYVAVRGGVRHGGEVLGSLSSDVLSGLGPAPLTVGSSVATGSGQVAPTRHGTNPLRVPDVLRIVPGPRDDWFVGGAEALTGRAWTVSPASNRVGVRLSGAAVDRDDDRELPSEGMVAGSVQVPPDGQPVLFLRDHAVTGGYPVIAAVIAEDLDAAAQLAPGATVRFEEYT
ncbi:urea amidolyase family protein [Corynebacterium glyciniphilum]|uniref:5-oxoprolinase subunit B/C family protein n=1 Tax=Corynebacterium glyciniphilum TaxID=1404244 RepID=UPI0026F1202C|nr:urea amidolyase family protein [Corynebacterium glyciniphilum]